MGTAPAPGSPIPLNNLIASLEPQLSERLFHVLGQPAVQDEAAGGERREGDKVVRLDLEVGRERLTHPGERFPDV